MADPAGTVFSDSKTLTWIRRIVRGPLPANIHTIYAKVSFNPSIDITIDADGRDTQVRTTVRMVSVARE